MYIPLFRQSRMRMPKIRHITPEMRGGAAGRRGGGGQDMRTASSEGWAHAAWKAQGRAARPAGVEAHEFRNKIKKIWHRGGVSRKILRVMPATDGADGLFAAASSGPKTGRRVA
jgi:hypothetical protein